jgi:NADPH:quinone reductase
MRALVCTALTSDLSGLGVEDVADLPPPGMGQVRLKIEAASLNFPDLLMAQGLYQFRPDPPFVPGMDVAGTVVALGPTDSNHDGERLAVGDRVAGGARLGGFAQYANIAANALSPMPPAFSFAEGAAYPAAYLTAYVALVRRANLQPGETLLIHGASGGVGLAAVDLGKLLGARVIASSANPDKLKTLIRYGADHVVLARPGFRDAVKELTDGKGVDVVFDPVGGETFEESVRALAFDGRLLLIGFTAGRPGAVKTNHILIKAISVMGVRAGEYGRQFPDRGRENLAAIWDLAHAGKTRPRVHASLPLADWRAAFSLMESRQLVGKVVLLPHA